MMKKTVSRVLSLFMILLVFLSPFLPAKAEDKLPKGFVSPQSVGIYNYDTMKKAVYNGLEAVYAEPVGIDSTYIGILNNSSEYYAEDQPVVPASISKLKPIIVGKPSYVGKKDTDLTIQESTSGSKEARNGESMYSYTYDINVTVSDLSLDTYQIQYSVKGKEHSTWKEDYYDNTYNEDRFQEYDTPVDQYLVLGQWTGSDYDDPEGKVYLNIAFPSPCKDVEPDKEWKKSYIKYEVTGVKFAKEAGGIEITSDASTNSGDSVFSVPAAIVLGTLTAAGAIGGAGAGLRGSVKDGEEEEEKKRRFKMVVTKNFGDAVRKGAEPVRISAHMVETDEKGVDKDRPDLTKKIKITGDEDLSAKEIGFVGNVVAADIFCDEEVNSDIGTITFTFTGDGGEFVNNLQFRLVGEPRIQFIEGDTVLRSRELDVLAGDNRRYTVDFMFEDATVEPEEITFESGSDFSVTLKKAEQPLFYTAVLKNLTLSDHETVFIEEKEQAVTIRAKVGKDVITESFTVRVLPYGLSFRAKDVENGYLKVDTLRNEQAGEFDYEILPTFFETVLAYYEETETGSTVVQICKSGEYSIDFGEILSEDKDAGFAYEEGEDYEFRAISSNEGNFGMVPKKVLPMAQGPYKTHVFVNATCSNGVEYSKFLPIIFYGEEPKLPDEKELEMEKLRKDMAYFGFSGDPYIKTLLRDAENLTAYEVNLIRRAIIIEATGYYLRERDKFINLDTTLGYCEFAVSSIKWINDQAFSYLVTVYGGGPAVEAFVTPLKELVLNFIGELSAASYWGGEAKMTAEDIATTFIAGIENTVSNVMGEALATPPNLKKIGTMCAYMLFVGFAKRYSGISDKGQYQGKFYDSMCASFGDLSNNMLKNILSNYLGSALKSDKGFCKKLGDYLVKNLGPKCQMKSTDLIAKYLTEEFGLVFSNVFDNIKKDGGEMVTESGNYQIDITIGDSTLTLDIGASLSGIVNVLFDALLEPFSFLSKTTAKPECPTYYRSNV